MSTSAWSAGPRPGLFRQRNFQLLFVGIFLSSLGDYLALLTLTLKVRGLLGGDTPEAAWAVAGLLLAGLVPLVAFARPAGLLVDRRETVRLLVVVSMAQAAVAVGLAFAENVPVIIALSFLLGTGFAISQPALFALVPKVAGEHDLQKANANLEVARWGGAALGPLVAAGLTATFGARSALIADAVSFLIVAGAAALLTVRRYPEASEEEGTAEGGARPARGLALLWRDRVLRLAAGVTAAVVLFAAIDNVAEVFFAKDVLNGEDWVYGGLVACWTIGMVLGSTLIGRRLSPGRMSGAVFVAPLVGGAAVLVAAGFPAIGLALAMFVVGGVANGVENVAVRTMVHHRVPDRFRGRAFASFFGVINAAQIGAMAAGGALNALVGPRRSLLFAGAGAVLAGVLGLVAYAAVPAADRKATPGLEQNAPVVVPSVVEPEEPFVEPEMVLPPPLGPLQPPVVLETDEVGHSSYDG
jgi:MFS family permease